MKKQKERQIVDGRLGKEKAVAKSSLFEENLKAIEGIACEELDVDECVKTLSTCASMLGARVRIESVDGGRKRIVLDGLGSTKSGVARGVKEAQGKGWVKKSKQESLKWLRRYVDADADKSLYKQLIRRFTACKSAPEVIQVVRFMETRFMLGRKNIKSLKFFEGLSGFLTFERGSTPGNLLRTYNNERDVKIHDDYLKRRKEWKERDFD